MLATDEEIEPDDLCPMKTPKVIEETFLRTMKQVWDLLGCFYTQQWAGAEDGEGIRHVAVTGNE